MLTFQSWFKGFLLLISLITAVSIASAQTQPAKCTLTLAQIPEIRGIRLGMSLDQISSTFPEICHPSPLVPDKAGVITTFIAPPAVSEKNKLIFQDVKIVFFSFVDKRLYESFVEYENKDIWRGVNEFATQVSEKLKLPNAWKKGSSTFSEMECNGFMVRVQAGGITPEILLLDLGAQSKVNERRERQRKDFKP